MKQAETFKCGRVQLTNNKMGITQTFPNENDDVLTGNLFSLKLFVGMLALPPMPTISRT